MDELFVSSESCNKKVYKRKKKKSRVHFTKGIIFHIMMGIFSFFLFFFLLSLSFGCVSYTYILFKKSEIK